MGLLKTIINSLEKVKASDIKAYEMKGHSPLFDYIVIATVDSNRQGFAAASYLKEDLAIEKFEVRNIEGKETTWVLVDCNDVLIHIFTREEREHYNLEKMYLDIKQVDIGTLGDAD